MTGSCVPAIRVIAGSRLRKRTVQHNLKGFSRALINRALYTKKRGKMDNFPANKTVVSTDEGIPIVETIMSAMPKAVKRAHRVCRRNQGISN
jgi:hypothetical protein